MIRAALALALGAASLYDQAVVTLLHERFRRDDVSYILIETSGGRIVDQQWPDASRPIAMGSLVKPFTTLAYGKSHGYRYPEFVCRGSESGCWLPSGHGKVGIVEAIAQTGAVLMSKSLDADVSGKIENEHTQTIKLKLVPQRAEAKPDGSRELELAGGVDCVPR